MVLVLIAVVPLTDRVAKPVTVSVTPSPKTALPAMVSVLALPNNTSFVVTVLAVKAVFTPKVTASLKVCAPVVRTAPPLIKVLPPASVVRLLSFSASVLPPIAPTSVVVPLSLIAKLRLVPSDLTVPPKVTATPFKVVFAPKVTGPVNVWAALVVTVPPLTSMSLDVIVKLVSGAVTPTEPPSTTLLVAPLASITSARGGSVASLLTVPATLTTALAPVAVMLASVLSTTVPPYVWLPLEATSPFSTVLRATVTLDKPVLLPPVVKLPLPLVAFAATVRLKFPPAKVEEVVTVVPVKIASLPSVKAVK